MKVKDLMAPTEAIAVDAKIAQAAQRMREKNLGTLVVMDGAQVTGLVSDRDITTRGSARGLDPLATSIREVMTTDIAGCLEESEIEEAANIMIDSRVRRLTVFDQGSHRPVGVLSVDDFASRPETAAQGQAVLRALARSAEEATTATLQRRRSGS